MDKTVLVTGGAGFIGSHLVRRLCQQPATRVVVADCLTYAGNLANLDGLPDGQHYIFEKVDITDRAAVGQLFATHQPTTVFHLAAESHVDRSILAPAAFVATNLVGTANLLEAAGESWANATENRFIHVSTDEVYGSLGSTGAFSEASPYDPRSPYSATKAGSDMLARAYYHTYSLPVIITNSSNNYGPRQFPEKLIPLTILNLLQSRPVPVYGNGLQVRDWLWVEDHVAALVLISQKGKPRETYLIGARNEQTNVAVIEMICDLMEHTLVKPKGSLRSLIEHVQDRPGHDTRYAIDPGKVENELGWRPKKTWQAGLAETVAWYLQHTTWVTAIQATAAYQQYYGNQYTKR